MPKIEMTEDEIVKKEFARRFSTWDIPVEQLDITLGKLPNEQRQEHYFELQSILEKKAFHREIADWKRRISRSLALGTTSKGEMTELERQGLRQTLCEIEAFVEMLQRRSEYGKRTTPLAARSKNV